VIGAALMVAMVLAQAESPGKAPAAVQVDCAKAGEADLVKKFDMCQTGWSPADKWTKAAKGRMRPLKLRHIRIVGALLPMKWAQLFDTGAKNNKWGNLGVIDIETGKPKPIYNVFLMYAMMPVRRVADECPGPLRCLAGADEATVAVMLYNTTAAAAPARVTIRNHPFAGPAPAHLSVLSVDKDHSSFWETAGTGELEVTDRRMLPAGAKAIELDVTVPGPGVKLLLLTASKPAFPPGVIDAPGN